MATTISDYQSNWYPASEPHPVMATRSKQGVNSYAELMLNTTAAAKCSHYSRRAASSVCTSSTTIATPSSSLMSSTLINIHRHTSHHLCQILELLRVTTATMATTTVAQSSSSPTHSLSTDHKTTATTTASTANRARQPAGPSTASGTIITSILPDKVNEPVKCLTMTEQRQSELRRRVSNDDGHHQQPALCHCAQLPTVLDSGLRLFETGECRLCEAELVPAEYTVFRQSSSTTSSRSRHWSRPSSSSSSRSAWSLLTNSLRSSLCPSMTSSATSSLFVTLLLLFSFMLHTADSCSSRSTPKPRPPTPTTRPNITFQTYACPEAYAKWYCLNGATCFSVRIGESILYNCECSDGYMGQRCEFKDLDGSYLPSREKILVETAGIAGGVTLAVLLVVVISISYYTYVRNHMRAKSPPLLGYGQPAPAREYRDLGHDNVAFYGSYQSNIKQHYQQQQSTLAKGSKVVAAAAASYGTYGTTFTGRHHYEPVQPGHCSPAVATAAVNQCIACMSNRHQATGSIGKSSHAPPPPPAANQTQSHVLDLEHGIISSTASLPHYTSSPSNYC